MIEMILIVAIIVLAGLGGIWAHNYGPDLPRACTIWHGLGTGFLISTVVLVRDHSYVLASVSGTAAAYSAARWYSAWRTAPRSRRR